MCLTNSLGISKMCRLLSHPSILEAYQLNCRRKWAEPYLKNKKGATVSVYNDKKNNKMVLPCLAPLFHFGNKCFIWEQLWGSGPSLQSSQTIRSWIWLNNNSPLASFISNIMLGFKTNKRVLVSKKKKKLKNISCLPIEIGTVLWCGNTDQSGCFDL